MSWWHAVWVVLVLAVVVVYYAFAHRGGDDADDGFDRARFLSDRSDPRKFWAQAAIALYQDASDPGCWTQENALHCLQRGWSTPNGAELIELIQSYVQGECNVGFDKLRIIFLARAGRGAGWFDEATSWGYAFNAIVELQRHYSSWEQLRVAMDEGRAEWYGGKDQVPPAQVELSESGWNNLKSNYMSQVPFTMAPTGYAQSTFA